MRPIDADMVVSKLNVIRAMRKRVRPADDKIDGFIDVLVRFVEEQKTVEIEKHGQWVVTDALHEIMRDEPWYRVRCSQCDGSFFTDDPEKGFEVYKYCRNCGAKMEVSE